MQCGRCIPTAAGHATGACFRSQASPLPSPPLWERALPPAHSHIGTLPGSLLARGRHGRGPTELAAARVPVERLPVLPEGGAPVRAHRLGGVKLQALRVRKVMARRQGVRLEPYYYQQQQPVPGRQGASSALVACPLEQDKNAPALTVMRPLSLPSTLSSRSKGSRRMAAAGAWAGLRTTREDGMGE